MPGLQTVIIKKNECHGGGLLYGSKNVHSNTRTQGSAATTWVRGFNVVADRCSSTQFELLRSFLLYCWALFTLRDGKCSYWLFIFCECTSKFPSGITKWLKWTEVKPRLVVFISQCWVGTFHSDWNRYIQCHFLKVTTSESEKGGHFISSRSLQKRCVVNFYPDDATNRHIHPFTDTSWCCSVHCGSEL